MDSFRIYSILLIAAITFGCNKELPPVDDIKTVPVISTSPMTVINDIINKIPVVVAASKSGEIMVAFKSTLDGEVLNFKSTSSQPPIALIDDSGTTWDIFGFAVSGIHYGKQLEPANSMMGFWFGFASFYPGITIHPKIDPGPNDGEEIVGSGGWTVPSDEIRDGGPGKDGIPAISNPKFNIAKHDTFLESEDLVVGFFDGEEYKAYPHKILNWHEIVNEKKDDQSYSIIYCPLTGTATAWSGNFDSGRTSYGVSGLLYNSNIIAYDRETDSYWSQIKGEAIYGTRLEAEPEIFPVVETTWEKWLSMYPNSYVMTTETGFTRDYDRYPYGSYNLLSSDYLIFNVKYEDDRLPKKQRVLSVIEGNVARVYIPDL